MYAYLVTYRVWSDNLLPLVERPGLERDGLAVPEALAPLWSLVELCANVLGLDGYDIDQLRNTRVKDHAQFMKRIPRLPTRAADLEHSQERRLRLVRDLDTTVEDFCGRLDLGGAVPARVSM